MSLATRWGLLACLLSAAPLARAEPASPAPAFASLPRATLPDLEGRAARLADADEKARGAALAALLSLEPEALPAIEARLGRLASQDLDAALLLDGLVLIRSLAGDAPADAEQPAASLLAALARDRSVELRAAVELCALLHALERQRSIAASTLIVNGVFAVAPKLFRSEAARTRKRVGKLLAPGFVRARAHGKPALQKLAKDGLAALGLGSHARLFGERDPELLEALLTATADVQQEDALPWLVAFVDDPRPNVRAAARHAVASFGDRATPLLRVRLTELGVAPSDGDGSAADLLSRLGARADQLRAAPALEALGQAERSLSRQQDLDGVTERLHQALSVGVPAADQTRLARAYLALGAQRDAQDRRAEALTAFRRALRSDPEGPHAEQARARVLYLEAEDRLAAGIADSHSLRAALALDPRQPAASALSRELERVRDGEALAVRKWLGLSGAGLLMLASLLTLHVRKRAASA